jgi:glycosyltransferase involved in cell wall biosynthesis
LKVLYFTQDYSPHDERFLNALSLTDHEIFFLRLEPRQPVHLRSNVNEVYFPSSGESSSLTTAERITAFNNIIDTVKPDVIHAGPLHGPAFVTALSSFPRLVSMSWGADILHDGEVSSDSRENIQYTLDHSAVFVCDCLAVEEKALADYGVSAERIYRFPWGVDLEHFTPEGSASYRAKLGWQDKFVFLSNRSFAPIYGVDITLHAFISAAQQNPDIRLLLFGKGSQEQELRSMIREAGVADKVHFGGFVDRVGLPDSYRSADVFLSASHCDGSSVSLMEALACGVPALISDIPGNMEWVNDGKEGWIFHDGDVDQMASLMHSARHESNLAGYSRCARAQAEAHADWRRNFPILLKAYDHAARGDTNSSSSQEDKR